MHRRGVGKLPYKIMTGRVIVTSFQKNSLKYQSLTVLKPILPLQEGTPYFFWQIIPVSFLAKNSPTIQCVDIVATSVLLIG